MPEHQECDYNENGCEICSEAVVHVWKVIKFIEDIPLMENSFLMIDNLKQYLKKLEKNSVKHWNEESEKNG